MTNITQLLDYETLWFEGWLTTAVLSVCAIGLGTLLAIIVVVGEMFGGKVLRLCIRIYVDLLRSIPVLVLLVLLFFFVPSAMSIRVPPLWIGVLAFGINLSPFASECIRSGLNSVPREQYDSCKSLGFTETQTLLRVILPQAATRIAAPLIGQYITTVKLTSLGAIIGIVEIWNVTGQVVSLTALPLEARLFGAILYVVTILPLLYITEHLAKKWQIKGLGYLQYD